MISEEYIKNNFENIKLYGFNLFFFPQKNSNLEEFYAVDQALEFKRN